MQKLKVMTILGTRPEIIRLSEVIKKCDLYFDHILVHTGQNYDYTLNQVFFEDLSLRSPDYYLNCAGNNLGETMGNIISKSYDLMDELRKIVDHISDINLPYTEHSRRYLISEGIDGKTVFVTGSPMGEVLAANEQKAAESKVLNSLGLEKKQYILLSAHREENIDIEKNFISLMNAINDIAEAYDMPIIYSIHPRSKKFIEKRGHKFHPLVKSMRPFGFLDYSKLQQNAYCVISDSGTLSEESALLGFPAVLLRTSTERPESLDEGSVVLGGITARTIEQAIDLAVEMHKNCETVDCPKDYKSRGVSAKVVRIIQSYTDIVNRTVWRKE